jgi:hypothetical protein
VFQYLRGLRNTAALQREVQTALNGATAAGADPTLELVIDLALRQAALESISTSPGNAGKKSGIRAACGWCGLTNHVEEDCRKKNLDCPRKRRKNKSQSINRPCGWLPSVEIGRGRQHKVAFTWNGVQYNFRRASFGIK